MRILLVEDDTALADGIREALQREHFDVDHLSAAELAENALALTPYDLAVIDIGLPVMSGLELIRRVRRRGIGVPVLILTARDALEDRVNGLNTGADDYLIKPFLLPELLARINALIRRSRAVASPVLTLGALRVDTAQRAASASDSALDLTGREWNVLVELMLAAPAVATKQKLADSLSNWDNEITPNAIEIYISRLRAKLNGARVTIRTIRGLGYRIEESRDA
jgi:two-component system, OmpR family, response regulator